MSTRGKKYDAAQQHFIKKEQALRKDFQERILHYQTKMVAQDKKIAKLSKNNTQLQELLVYEMYFIRYLSRQFKFAIEKMREEFMQDTRRQSQMFSLLRPLTNLVIQYADIGQIDELLASYVEDTKRGPVLAGMPDLDIIDPNQSKLEGF